MIHLPSTCYSDKVVTFMQPVVLTMTLVSSNHVHKTVVNAKSDMGTFIKEINELPKWHIASAARHENPDKGTVHDMIREWNDGVNHVFPFAPRSYQESEFWKSKRGIFLKSLPKFSAAPASNIVSSISSSPLIFPPMSLALEITSDNVPHGVIKT